MAQLTGVHRFELGAPITLHLDPAQVYVFDAAGDAAASRPAREEHADMARIDLDLAHAYKPNPQQRRATTRCCR